MNATDIIGQRFGRLTVISKGDKTKQRSWMYVCECDCGNIIDRARASDLRNGRTTSCGCRRKENIQQGQLTGDKHHAWTGKGAIPGSMWYTITARAKAKGYPLTVTFDEVYQQWELQNHRCALSGEELEFGVNQKANRAGKCTASLDRIDPTKGYALGNIQWIHKDLNWMKLDFTQTEFINWCRKVVIQNDKISVEKVGIT